MSRSQLKALTNHPVAQAAADECLKAKGSALDAVLSAYFAIAGVTSWGLLAPVTILTAGSGFGVRAIDGRARQPGRGIAHPIRYHDEASAPLIARVSASTTATAVSLAVAMFGRATQTELAQRGARLARKFGASQRAGLITRLGAVKARVLQERSFLAEVAERVPRFNGALLQPVDLAVEAVDVVACEPISRLAGVSAAIPPWHDPSAVVATPEVGNPLESAQEPSCLLALAVERGSFAALLLQRSVHSIPLLDGEVDLPVLGQPILKGITRLRAGSPLPLAAPLAVLFDGPRITHMVASLSTGFNEEEIKQALAIEASRGLTHQVGKTLAISMATSKSD